MAEAEVVRLFQEPATIDVFDPGTERAPKNAQAEKTVIGTLLARNKALDSIIDILQPGQFSDPLMGRIFEEIRDRLVDGVSVDVVTLADWVSGDRTFGGDQRKATQYLAGLLANSVSVSIRGYGVAIGNCALRRDLAAVANKIAALVRDPMSDVRTKVTELAAELDGAALGTDKQRVASFDDALDAAMREASEAQERGDPGGLPLTNWPRLARSIVMKPKELTCLAAIPGGGKSGLGWQLAIGMAREFRDSGRPIRETGGVLGFSLEMGASALATRALSAASGVDAWNIQRGDINDSEKARIKAAREELRGLPLDLLDINGLTKESIKTLMYRQKLRWGKIALTIVDHCNLVAHGTYGERHGKAAGTADVADAMLELCKTFDTHMLALVQLNLKEIKARKDPRPELGDMRYSSNFEQNANNVLFLHREFQRMSDVPPAKEQAEDGYAYQERRRIWEDRRAQVENEADLIIAKNRMGPAGLNIKLIFEKGTTSFSERPF